jgi:hypothetical protein
VPIYEHVDADGQVTEKCRPAANSKNAAALAAKAKDDKSGWRLAVAEKPAPAPRAARPAAEPSK